MVMVFQKGLKRLQESEDKCCFSIVGEFSKEGEILMLLHTNNTSDNRGFLLMTLDFLGAPGDEDAARLRLSLQMEGGC